VEEPDAFSKKQAILKYWTLVEFFSPYILENVLDNKRSYRKIYTDDKSCECLPWLNVPVIDEQDQATPLAKGYHLYLGLFSVEETADRARHTFSQNPSHWQSVNWENCIENTSCFARLAISTHGIPLLGSLTLSTLPWAHGRLLEEKREFISLEEYWKSVNRFILTLNDFSKELPSKLMKEPKEYRKFLDLDSLKRLVTLLYDWSGYRPQGYPIALVEELLGDNTLAVKESLLKNERDIPILNSFYIQDLESATASLNLLKNKPIDLYLDNKQRDRIALDSEEGVNKILELISPEKTPSGRWPEAPSRKQSLMQQFAINASFESRLFSVNGPPGTGKTLLLREIIAANIVARAKALSKFKTAQQAFIGRQAVNFENHDPVHMSELDPSLLGFEMLVVSSNNTAVQILSKELPLRAQLAPSFQYASYLEKVATSALGVQENDAWGLISATLGNVENCRKFVENVFIYSNEVKGNARIWDWIDTYDGLSFAEARDNFISIMRRKDYLSERLERLAFLHDEVSTHDAESYCKEELKALLEAEEKSEQLQLELSQLVKEEGETKEYIELIKEREKLWKAERPNLLVRLTNRKAAKEWSEKSKKIKRKRLKATEGLLKCKSKLKETHKLILEQNKKENELIEELVYRAFDFHIYKENYETLKATHQTAKLPHCKMELSHSETYYQTDELNRIRSELFIAAMTLHEAWLAETLRVKGGFRGNLMAISHIIQGKIPTTKDDTRLVWQSVFLLIPVISSTFASVGRLFSSLELERLAGC
jgi:hypothetical protein